MIIKCPECKTSYNIPESKIGHGPKKMRCSKCSNIFVLRRTSTIPPPPGYEEITSSDATLPDEFSFLKETKKKPGDEKSKPPMARPHSFAPPSPQRESKDGKPSIKAPFPEVPGKTPKDPAPQVKDEPVVTVEYEPPPPSPPDPATTEKVEIKATTALRESQDSTSSVTDIYNSTSSWEKETPLDLAGFTMDGGAPSKQLFGKFITLLLVAVILFFLFVAYRNNWSISFDKITVQIAFAISSAKRDTLPDEVRGLEVTIKDKNTLITNDKSVYLLVEGDVFNNNPASRSHIVLRGRILDRDNQVLSEAKAPCGVLLEKSVIKKTPRDSIRGHYLHKGKQYDCSLKDEANTAYQLIFKEIPIDYNPAFKVEVIPFSARYPQRK